MIPSLAIMREKLKLSIVGQEDLVNTSSLCVYRHLYKIQGIEHVQLEPYPNNLLIVGNTGTGKTYTVQKLAKEVNLPFIEINSKSIAQEGWEGTSLLKLLTKSLTAHMNHPKRYYPIVFLDEFDKLCTPQGSSTDANVSIHIQSSILKYIEGLPLQIGNLMYNTNEFCFIFAGAFTDLFKTERTPIGYQHTQMEQLENTTDITNITDITDKLIKFGMLPELAGRITRFCKTNDFTREMYKELLCNKNSSFNRWFNYLRQLGFNRKNEPDYTNIITKAVNKKLGARGLIQLLEPEIDRLIEENKDSLVLNRLSAGPYEG